MYTQIFRTTLLTISANVFVFVGYHPPFSKRSPYDIRIVFARGSKLRGYVFRVKPPTEFNMTKNCVYSIPYSCGKIYKGETGSPLKVRPEEHRKAVVRGEIEKSGMADHIWKEKGNHLPL